jgi:hypothetical protein
MNDRTDRNVDCLDCDRIFEDGTPAQWAALEAHAAVCATCAEELHALKSLSAAADELRDYAPSPSLWHRIERSLAKEAARTAHRGVRWNWPSLRQSISLSWPTAAASAVVLLLVFSGWLRLHRATPPESSDLLRSKALVEVQRTESAYVQAIDKLAADAKPRLENPETTSLLANYREKLLVLDSAIDDLHAQTGQNPSNAHLRYQLLAMYQEKQRTLEDVLGEKR